MKTRDKTLGFALIIFLLYMSPLFILQDNMHVTNEDNLDGGIPLHKTLSESGKIFAPNDSLIPNLMNGMPRRFFYSGFDA